MNQNPYPVWEAVPQSMPGQNIPPVKPIADSSAQQANAAPQTPYQGMPIPMPQQAVPPRKPDPPRLQNMRGQFRFFGLATAVYAFFFTFCLYKNYSGITFPFFVSGTLYFFCLCMRRLSIPLKKDAAFYMISIILLGIATFLTDDGSIIFMNYIAVIILLISFMLHHFYEDGKWDFTKYCAALFATVGGSIGCIGHLFADFSTYRKEKKGEKNNTVIYAFLGLLAAAPLLLLILTLLASADIVFSNMLDRILDNLFQLDDIFGSFIWFIAAFVAAYSLLAFLCRKDSWKEQKNKRTGEPALAITFTALLSIVYIIFSGIQIVYLFLGKMELPEGYTYAQYARRGFFQLLFVCILNLIIVLICMYRFRESRILKAILTVISVCTYIMTASSALRMLMYIQFYYLTFLRLFVLWSLAVISILMAGVLITVYRNRFPLFRYSMVVVTVLYLALSFSRPDYWIAKYNVSNFTSGSESDVDESRGGYQDIYYLSTLSMDAAPILLDRNKCTEEVYNKILANGYVIRAMERTEDMGIRNFNLSRLIAGTYVIMCYNEG